MRTFGKQEQATPKKPAHCAGFSLLEVLMAVTVLIVIVLIIALVFQQAHTAWGAGTRRAGAETTLRSIMGTIERDLVHAMDANQFPPYKNLFGANEMEFITVDGTNRMPVCINYKFDGQNLTRTSYQLASSGGQWDDAGAPAISILNGSTPLNYPTPPPRPMFSYFYPESDPGHSNLPTRVEIEVHVTKEGSLALVSGWSEGRGRKNHPEDKIVASP